MLKDGDLLTANQRRIVAGALTALSLVTITAFLVLVFLLFRAFIGQFAMVILPLAVAGIIAMILQPGVRWVQRKLGMKRVWSVMLLTVAIIFLLASAAVLLLPPIMRQAVEFVQTLPEIGQNALNFLDKQLPTVSAYIRERLANVRVEDATEQLRAVAGPAANSVMAALSQLKDWALSAGTWVTALGIIPIYVFFFLLVERDPTRDLSKGLDFLPDEYRRDIVFLVRVFVQNIEAFFRGQIVIGLLMGVLYAIGFSIAGLKFGLVIGLLLGLLNIVPYLGSIVGLALALPIAYLQPGGGLEMIVWTLGVFTAVQMVEGWLLTPRIMGNMTGLHPVTVIIAIFFWGTALDGILGMILAIPLTAFLIVAWKFVLRRYIGNFMEGAANDHIEARDRTAPGNDRPATAGASDR